MGFAFDAAYRYRDQPNGTWSLAIGVIPEVLDYAKDPGLCRFRFITTFEHHHEDFGVVGRVTRADGDDTIEVFSPASESGLPEDHTYRFEKLTIDRWYEMRDRILGFAAAADGIGTDEELQTFYTEGWIDDDWESRADDLLGRKAV